MGWVSSEYIDWFSLCCFLDKLCHEHEICECELKNAKYLLCLIFVSIIATLLPTTLTSRFITVSIALWETAWVAMQTVTREFMSSSFYSMFCSHHTVGSFYFYYAILFMWRSLKTFCFKLFQIECIRVPSLKVIIQQIPMLVAGCITVISDSNCRQFTSYVKIKHLVFITEWLKYFHIPSANCTMSYSPYALLLWG